MTAPLAVTMGDPAGIGGELTVKAWHARGDGIAPFYAVDDPARLDATAQMLGIPCPVVEISDSSEAIALFADALPVLSCPLAEPQMPGIPNPANAASVIQSIQNAVADAKAGDAAAVVTNPINKRALHEGADFPYPGHTEFLGALGGVETSVMMLAAPGLRVVPLTIHVALREVFDLLTHAHLCETARIIDKAMRRDFGIASPRIAVSGLNPHAGEGGSMGREEIEIIAPAIAALQAEGVAASGPWPADTMFHDEARAGYDVALCMYHDQALIPLKTMDFHGGVNVTLGLPFVRTSPDHGTAYDRAGKGTADPRSFIEALRVARAMADARAVGA